MANRVKLPDSISQHQYIVVRYSRDTLRYEMLEPNRVNSYDLGVFVEAYAWFEKLGMMKFGERCLSASKNFGAAMGIMKDRRVFGLDVCQVDPTRLTRYREDIDENRGMPDDSDDDDDMITFISGEGSEPKTPRTMYT
jgi:hypothetical protein